MSDSQTNASSSEHSEQDVLFYVLNSTEPEKRLRFLSKLLQKILSENRRCDVRFENEQEAFRYDLMLWDFKPESFIAHSVGNRLPAPVQLYGEQIEQPCRDVLVNLHPNFPEGFSRYHRTIEILDQTEHLVQMGRERWKTYKSKGIEPTVHKIGF